MTFNRPAYLKRLHQAFLDGLANAPKAAARKKAIRRKLWTKRGPGQTPDAASSTPNALRSPGRAHLDH